MKQSRTAPRAVAAMLAGLLLLTACGGSDTTSTAATDSAPATDGSTDALSPEDLADQNLPNLVVADDARDIEMLSVFDGSVATLRDAVDGDRPVLLWFWAPH